MEFEQLLDGWNEELLESEGVLEIILILLLLRLLEESGEENVSDIKELLRPWLELGIPVPRVHLVNGDVLQNVVVVQLFDTVAVFKNATNQLRVSVPYVNIVSWGAF
ncbi:spore maturation protein CgeC [Bacillus safensis FO-36b]|uniref:spore maturation protein CgeC n=1 Tax=Bacillus TaxID=1386 RepID=UPI00045CE51D|nr:MULTISPECIES: spore maturation protein CgeC [Bacillus]MBK4211956.1 spore maturation protein [Bacillus pumilus]MBY0190835.1 spore maturation protein [Bacillus aerophilus]ARD56497.1 spore maturation protein [Bacillus safensis]AWI37052.1 spore maturation protein [Bacillus safensis FO-36b]KDE29644.1 spore maturation protein CgeC [Bacillus safensis FO-36b]